MYTATYLSNHQPHSADDWVTCKQQPNPAENNTRGNLLKGTADVKLTNMKESPQHLENYIYIYIQKPLLEHKLTLTADQWKLQFTIQDNKHIYLPFSTQKQSYFNVIWIAVWRFESIHMPQSLIESWLVKCYFSPVMFASVRVSKIKHDTFCSPVFILHRLCRSGFMSEFNLLKRWWNLKLMKPEPD